MIDRIADAFSIDPERAGELDHQLVQRVMESRAARQAHEAFKDDRPMSPGQSDWYAVMMNALDRRDEERGIPPEP